MGLIMTTQWICGIQICICVLVFCVSGFINFRVFGLVGGATTSGTFTMKWLTSGLLPWQRETKNPRGRLRQYEVFFSTRYCCSSCCPTIVLVLSRIIQIFDRAIIVSDKVWWMSTLFALPFWFLRNIALPATAINPIHQWPSIRPLF